MGTTQTKETRRQTPAFRPKSSQHTTAQAAAAAGPQVQALANLQRMADTSPQIQASAGLQRMADTRATVQRRPDPAPVQRLEEDELQMKPIQRMEEDELQGKFIQRVEEEELQMKPIQRMEEDELQGKFIQRVEEEELLQGKALQRAEAPKANNTGLPDGLKSGIENLSGMSMDQVKVHRNSDKPAAVQAHAYAQGSDIHLGPGQEKHLPHEAWHVVQQAQGRVKPTMQMKGVAVNDDPGLETEADVMGAKALQAVAKNGVTPKSEFRAGEPASAMAVQRVLTDPGDAAKEADLISRYKAAQKAGDELAVKQGSAGSQRSAAKQYATAIRLRRQAGKLHVAQDHGHDLAIATVAGQKSACLTRAKALETQQTTGKKAKRPAGGGW